MIETTRPKNVRAECDSCKADLLDDIGSSDKNCNYGLLAAHFGDGSNFDGIGHGDIEYHLCEDCWMKALSAVGLDKFFTAQLAQACPYCDHGWHEHEAHNCNKCECKHGFDDKEEAKGRIRSGTMGAKTAKWGHA